MQHVPWGCCTQFNCCSSEVVDCREGACRLDVLDSKGLTLTEDEVVDLLSESKTMTKSVKVRYDQ